MSAFKHMGILQTVRSVYVIYDTISACIQWIERLTWVIVDSPHHHSYWRTSATMTVWKWMIWHEDMRWKVQECLTRSTGSLYLTILATYWQQDMRLYFFIGVQMAHLNTTGSATRAAIKTTSLNFYESSTCIVCTTQNYHCRNIALKWASYAILQ